MDALADSLSCALLGDPGQAVFAAVKAVVLFLVVVAVLALVAPPCTVDWRLRQGGSATVRRAQRSRRSR